MSYVQPNVISQAREVDLYSFLLAREPSELVKCYGGEYCTKSHDSLKISNGKWFWHSRGMGGVSALDYLIKVRNMDFVEAVKCVVGTTVLPPSSVPQTKKKYSKLYLPPCDFECKTVKPYLLSRGLDEGIIDFFIARKMIAEDKENGYALFIGHDENGKSRHCSVRATDGTSLKKDAAGSDKRYPFRLVNNGKKTLRVFESAVDLMSYLTIKKMRGESISESNYLSLSGVYLPRENVSETKLPMAIEYYLEHNKTENIILYLDNDFAGHRMSKAIYVLLGEHYKVVYRPPPVGKDYNEYLQTIVKNREEKER